MHRSVTILLALATLFGACSSGADEAPGDGRLVIIDDTGNVVTAAPNGTDAVSVADAFTNTHTNSLSSFYHRTYGIARSSTGGNARVRGRRAG